jgi:hypothetical protein
VSKLNTKTDYTLGNPLTSEALSVKEGRAPELPIVTRKDGQFLFLVLGKNKITS